MKVYRICNKILAKFADIWSQTHPTGLVTSLQDIPAAREYFAGKVKYVTEQMEKVQAVGQEKNKIREAVMDVMETKLSAQFRQQNLSGSGAGTSQASS